MNRKQQKFGRIYDKYVESIYRFIFIKVSSHETAEDLTSEVFLKSWQVFQSSETRKSKREKIRNPRAFLYATARNLVIDFYRTKKRDKILSIEEAKEIEDIEQRIEEKEKVRSDLALIQKRLNSLKEDYQNVIIWRYVDGLSIREIAKILDKSPGAIRVLLHRAMKQLKEQFDSAK